jgi:hypothetical protein
VDGVRLATIAVADSTAAAVVVDGGHVVLPAIDVPSQLLVTQIDGLGRLTNLFTSSAQQ